MVLAILQNLISTFLTKLPQNFTVATNGSTKLCTLSCLHVLILELKKDFTFQDSRFMSKE